jgi:hypothetical protein
MWRKQLGAWEEEMLRECQDLLHGCGVLTLVVVTRCGMHISYWLLNSISLWVQLKILSGTDRSRWRYLFLHGDSCETGYQQIQIWWLETSLPQNLIFAWPVVVALNQLGTYSYLATYSRSLSSFYLFIRRTSRAAVFPIAHLALMCLSCVEREKS